MLWHLRSLADNVDGDAKQVRGPSRRLLFLASGCYVAGAIGVEMVGSHLFATSGRGWLFGLTVTVEELLELTGTIVFLYALLTSAAAHHYGVHLQIENPVRQPRGIRPVAHFGTLAEVRYAPIGVQTNAMANGQADGLPSADNGDLHTVAALARAQPD